MMVLVSYDVSTVSAAGRRRLRRVARACLDLGQRVQLSVFECALEPAQWAALKHRLIKEIDPATDSLRFYYLGANWRRRVVSVARGMSGFGSSRSVRFRRIGEVACWRRFGWLGSLRRSVGGGAGH